MLLIRADVKCETKRWFDIGGRSLLLGRGHPVRVTMSRGIVVEMQGYKGEAFASA
jgi:hypothetical protein